MFGVYMYQEFKGLVVIEKRKVYCEIAVPIIKIKDKRGSIVIDFRYDNEYIIHRDSIQLPVGFTTKQVNQAVFGLYQNFCNSIFILNQEETDENRHTKV